MFVSESSTSLGFIDPLPHTHTSLPARCFTRYCSSRISFPRALLMRSFGFFFVPRCLSITVTVMSHNHAKFIPMRCLSFLASYPFYSVSSFSCVSIHRLKIILSLQQTFPHMHALGCVRRRTSNTQTVGQTTAAYPRRPTGPRRTAREASPSSLDAPRPLGRFRQLWPQRSGAFDRIVDGSPASDFPRTSSSAEHTKSPSATYLGPQRRQHGAYVQMRPPRCLSAGLPVCIRPRAVLR